MEWYYAIDKQQHGPVSSEEFAGLVRQGVITGSTLVWRKGMVDWIRYEEVAASRQEAATDSTPKDGPAHFSASYPDPETWADQVKHAELDLSVGECFARGWEIFQRQMGVCIGLTLLLFLLGVVVVFTPFVGFVANLLLTGPITAGLYYFYIVMARGQEGSLGNAFKGFGPQFVPLMLAGILVMVIGVICTLPAIGVLIAGILSLGIIGANNPNPQEVLQTASVVAIILTVVGILAFVFLSMIVATFLQFAYPLILDKGVDVITAIKLSLRRCMKVWFTLVLIAIAGTILNIIGTFLCLIGLLFTVPWFMAAQAVAYEKLFPGETSKQNYY